MISGPHSADEHEVIALVEEADRLALQDLWPGFEPHRTPIAIYAPDRTYLFRHPSPPREFDPLPGNPDVYATDGLHPSVRANAYAEVGGVVTGIVYIGDLDQWTVLEYADMVIHELFHLYQHLRHLDWWVADERQLFAYPLGDAALLGLWRLETEALRRALGEDGVAASSGWALAALEVRRARFGHLPEGWVLYDRGIELIEGTAQYVEWRAVYPGRLPEIPEGGFAADDVRPSRYTTGHVLCRLLDRTDGDWRRKLEAGESRFLDELLSGALSGSGSVPSSFAEGEREAIIARARADACGLVAEAGTLRHEFLTQPGWRIEVLAPEGKPLMPGGFDPSQTRRLGDGEVLHQRYIELGGGESRMEVLGRSTLTSGSGENPLFDGVRKVVITGLDAEPMIRQEERATLVSARGVSGQFQDATVEHRGHAVLIQL